MSERCVVILPSGDLCGMAWDANVHGLETWCHPFMGAPATAARCAACGKHEHHLDHVTEHPGAHVYIASCRCGAISGHPGRCAPAPATAAPSVATLAAETPCPDGMSPEACAQVHGDPIEPDDATAAPAVTPALGGERCATCGGNGMKPNRIYAIRCPNCGGTGQQPAPAPADADAVGGCRNCETGGHPDWCGHGPLSSEAQPPAPDANCITTPDGGCVGVECMHDQLPGQTLRELRLSHDVVNAANFRLTADNEQLRAALKAAQAPSLHTGVSAAETIDTLARELKAAQAEVERGQRLRDKIEAVVAAGFVVQKEQDEVIAAQAESLKVAREALERCDFEAANVFSVQGDRIRKIVRDTLAKMDAKEGT